MIEEIELRTDNRLTTADDAVVTPEEARELHNWLDDAFEPEETITWAVMDSGVHSGVVDNHPWFEDAEVTKRFDATGADNGGDALGHGTGVASIISENVPEVEIYDVRIFGQGARANPANIPKAYDWLLEHADEIDGVNMSWGAQINVPPLNVLHEKLLAKGVYDVVAAGNTGAEGGSPATSKKAFSAGAVDEAGNLTRFTSRDPNKDNPDVAAVGKNVKMARAPGAAMGTQLDDDFLKASGTSFAAPYTSAAYVNALYRRRESWDAEFERAALDIPGTEADGEGLLKLRPAVEGKPVQDRPTTNASVWSFIGNDVSYLNADWLPDGDTEVEKLDETDEHVDVRYNK